MFSTYVYILSTKLNFFIQQRTDITLHFPPFRSSSVNISLSLSLVSREITGQEFDQYPRSVDPSTSFVNVSVQNDQTPYGTRGLEIVNFGEVVVVVFRLSRDGFYKEKDHHLKLVKSEK